MAAPTQPVPSSPAAAHPLPPRPRRALALDAVVLAAALILLAFAPLARVAASRLPITPPPPVTLPPLPAHARGGALRTLPEGVASTSQPPKPSELRAAAVALLGPRAAKRLLHVVSTRTTRRAPGDRVVDALIRAHISPAQVPAATRLAADFMLDSAPLGSDSQAAYALLTRAAATGACAPAVDLFLLLDAAQDSLPETPAAGREAIRNCPQDPTAGWLVAETQSLDIPPDEARPEVPALAPLLRRFPGSAAAWDAAGDAYLRQGDDRQGFIQRALYRRALADYRRAARLQPSPELQLGVAAALAGLGRPQAAATTLSRALTHLAATDSLDEALVSDLDSAHRFNAAAIVAGRLASLHRPHGTGPGVFPHLQPGDLPSLGASRFVPLVTYQQLATVGATSVVQDLAFLPVYHAGPLTDSQPDCPVWSQHRDELVAGRPAAALTNLPRSEDPLTQEKGCQPMSTLAGVATLELGKPVRAARRAALQDARENMWRWAGDLSRAERVARQWMQQAPRSSLAATQLGEILFLRKRFDEAEATFAQAIRDARAAHDTWSRPEANALLDRGAALIASGRRPQGEQELREAAEVAERAAAGKHDETLVELHAISVHAHAQLADSERERGALRDAADDYAAARAFPEGLDSEQVANNGAIVQLALGHAREAEVLTRSALRADPDSPVFLMTAGFAAARAGQRATAIRYDTAALAIDHTEWPAANDLGVLLAGAGHEEQAVSALRRAVGANPDYALAWFNLGVVLGHMGPLHVLASQGALARAIALDGAYADRRRVLALDPRTYKSGIDVSRALQPHWSFASSQQREPAKTAGLAAILLLAFGTSRVLASRGSARGLAGGWLEKLAALTEKRKFLRWLFNPLLAVLATVAIFLSPLARQPGAGTAAAVVAAVGVVVLVAAVARARAAALWREPAPAEPPKGWPPGVLFGAIAAVAGLLWAPLPVLGAKASTRAHWAAPLALAALALPLLALAVWTNVPLTRTLAAAGLVMAASVLTPLKPVDGGAIVAAGGAAASLTGLGLAALALLGLV